MAKYSETELIGLRTSSVVPTRFDFLEFTKQLEEQREIQLKLEEEESLNPRRRSSHAGTRPKFNFVRKPRVKHEAPQPDADGWVTLNKKKNSFGEEGAEEVKEQIKETIKDQKFAKIKASSKKMAGSNASSIADIHDKPKATFNAFSALDSEDEEEEEEEEDDDDDDDE